MNNIRSFVIRAGRMTESQRSAIRDYWSRYCLSSSSGKLNYQQIFGRRAKINIEIGFGMGDLLLQMAQALPEEDFIGIEVHKPGIGSLLLRLAKNSINNVRIYTEDAILVLNQAIENSSVDKIMLFFPDPWPKRRHHKRRLLQEEFICLLEQKLALGGVFHVATDWREYAAHIKNVMAKFPNFQSSLPEDTPLMRPTTKFELKGIEQGHEIWEMVYIKKI